MASLIFTMTQSNPFMLEQNVGNIPYSNEAVLSSYIEKKAITIDYDFPGYRSYGRLGQNSSLGIIKKNTVYGRLSTSPYLFRPIVMVKIYGSDGQTLTVRTADIPKLFNWNVENVSILTPSSELVRIWDDSAGAFMSGTNDKSCYIASVDYAMSSLNSTLTLSGALTTAVQTGSDYILVGNGLENLIDYVIVDEEVDCRVDRRPKALAANVSSSAIYRARINMPLLEQYRDWPTSFINALRTACQRIMWDIV